MIWLFLKSLLCWYSLFGEKTSPWFPLITQTQFVLWTHLKSLTSNVCLRIPMSRLPWGQFLLTACFAHVWAMQTFCSIPNIFLLRAQDSSSRNQSLPHPHLRVLVTTVWFWHYLCELILHRLRLVKFPRLGLNLCKAPMFTQRPVFPFFLSSHLAACLRCHHCQKQLPCWRITLDQSQQRCWAAVAVVEAHTGLSQGC